MAAGNATFFSELRRGAALGITRVDQSTTPVGPRALLDVHVNYDNKHDAQTQLPLVGPGDIIGLDTRTIVRMFPKPDDNEAESGFLAYVEIDQADLLWRYTPAKPQGAVSPAPATDRLRPWLSLIVLEEGAEFSDADLAPPSGKAKLPLLTINDAGLLPPSKDAWAWAHVHVQGTVAEGDLPGLLAGRPGTVVARLMSPRRLEDKKAYRAFLVPTFRRGAIAGRGDDPGATDALDPAWPFATGEPNTLPVYHSWRFQTGTVSSFDEAVRQLQPLASLPATVGERDLDVRFPGFKLDPPVTGTNPMQLLGALRKPPPPGETEPQISTLWTDELGSFIDLANFTLPPPDNSVLRVVTPPLYGRWYAAEQHLDQSTTITKTNPPWFHSLNSDPRHRIAAAMGTEVVQRDQQSLMASAWEQGARLDVVNRALRVMQTGREVFTRLLVRHIGTGDPTTVLTTTAPVHGRIFSCAPGPGPKPTITGIVNGTPFGGCFKPPWRRLFRGKAKILIDTINTGGFFPVPGTPGGTNTPDKVFPPNVPGGLPDPEITKVLTTMSSDQRLYWGVVIFWVARKLLISDGGRFWWLLRKLLRLGLNLISLASTKGATQIDLVQKIRRGDLAGAAAGAPPAVGFTVAVKDPDLSKPSSWSAPRSLPNGTGTDSRQATLFRAALGDLMGYVGAPTTGRTFNRLDVPSLVSCVLTTLSPAVTFVAAAQSRFQFIRTDVWKNADQLEPIQLAPRIERAMWEPLRDVSPEWILPGVGEVPRNTVSLLSTNQRFIESYLVGLNHEMTRELSWNGYSIDQRGTYFHQFWDSRGWVKGKDADPDRPPSAFDDIVPPIGWNRATDLGDISHTGRPSTDQLVLLVRGDVIKRFPNVIVYAAKAKDSGNGTLVPDDNIQSHPVFQSVLTGDVAYYGFELTQTAVRGSSTDSGWFFILQEHPSEPKFNQLAPEGQPNAFPTNYVDTVAAEVAKKAYETPLRVAIHGKDLVSA
ncbi:MAG TPA: hypothetical protein VN903_19355 [Polyangia bacterium]|jgi:hypothetical protein|nr:hypothetical protein [Polyangia bacterium]